jgi:hypothetical protein
MEHSTTATATAPAPASASAPPTALSRCVKLREAIEEYNELDPSLRCDRETVIEIHCLQSQLGYGVSTTVAAFDQWGAFAADGALTATAWIDTRCHIPKKEARAELRRGKALSGLPVAAAAWKRGDIGAAHIDALLRVKSPVTKEQLFCDEEILVNAGITLKFAEFAHVVDYWEMRADPDGTDEAAEAKRVRRDAYLFPSAGGYVGEMRFGTIDGAIVTKELKRIEQELFEADWAQAKERLGRDPHADELERTPAQRRADAMVEMAVRSASTPPGAKKPEPLFSVLVGFETLAERISEIEGGPVVTPGSLWEWMDRAEFERIVFSPGNRIECSKTARFFTGATKRAIEVRDRQCQHEYCDRPAEWCDIDHIVPWSEGGLTEQRNGQSMCGPHNRERYVRPPPEEPDEPPDG